MTPCYLTVSWSDFHRDALILAERVRAHGPYRGIVAISRGGLVPAAIFARALGIRVVETISVAAYDRGNLGQEQLLGQPMVTKLPVAAGDGEGFLIVDDLVDTGTTARLVRAMLPKARFVCVYAKPAGRALADDVLTGVTQDTWIVLPWEAPAGDTGQ